VEKEVDHVNNNIEKRSENCGKLHKILKERVLPCCMCTSNIEINSQVFNKQNVTYIQCT
jgi:hypothetical protein